MLDVIYWGLIVFGVGFYLAGMEFNTVVAKQSGMIMVFMGVIGLVIYYWGKRHRPAQHYHTVCATCLRQRSYDRRLSRLIPSNTLRLGF
jgi:hypothetical protein